MFVCNFYYSLLIILVKEFNKNGDLQINKNVNLQVTILWKMFSKIFHQHMCSTHICAYSISVHL